MDNYFLLSFVHYSLINRLKIKITLGIRPMYASSKPNFSILAVDSRYKHSGMTWDC